MKRKTNILHLLPHAGGGVGAVLRAVLAAESEKESPYRHVVASLDYLNDVTQKHFNIHGISWTDEVAVKRRDELSALLDQADIVLAHWWNHPLIMRLLFEGLPATRLIIWSHVNGYYPPQAFFPELFELPERFVFTSKVSMTVPAVQELSDDLKSRLRVIRSCAGIPSGSESLCPKSDPFRAGYIGTVEPVKMHADFLSMCANANMPTPVVVAGGPDHEDLRRQAQAMNLAGCFHILGPVKDASRIFRLLHAFAYPLSPRHYGTGEQVLIEAMAFGAVPVVLANPPEKALIRHGQTGLVADNAADFSAKLRMLMENPAERETLAAGGRRFVMEECGIEHSIKAFHALFEETLSLSKQPRKLKLQPADGVNSGSPLHLFLASLGNAEERRGFEKALQRNDSSEFPIDFASKTRGTSFHYLAMLGDDPGLKHLCNAVGWNRD
ncbi:MAG: glycosyltransferase family 4 protein [Deltaproteobacteria bacterium]|nr:glycosyltransferase family 4 protein [Deltaproteobacteria bacterium]